MKKTLRKVAAMLLALVLLTSGGLAACGDSSPGQDAGTDTTAPSVGNGDEGGSGEDSTAGSDEVVTLDIFINESWWPVDTFTGIIPEEIERITGVRLNLTIAADDNQLGLMIASNELPDLVFTSKELDRLSSDDFCISYNELIDNYVPEFQPDDLMVSIGKSFSSNEKFYALLNAFSTDEEWENTPVGAPGQACIYYRQDIYEAMGSPKMETLEDFLDVCDQVQQDFPELVPLYLGGFWKLQPISFWSGASGGNEYQYTEDGSVVYQSSSPKYKEFLQYANKMARQGYITAEAYANENEGDSHQAAYNNECFAYTWYLGPATLAQLNAETQKNFPEAQWGVLNPLGGEENAAYNTSKGWCGLFVSQDCKYPEKAAELISFLFSEEGRRLSKWGREGVEYTLDDNGLPVFSDEWNAAKDDPAVMNEKYNQYFYFGVTAVDEVLGDYVGLDDDLMSQFTAYKAGYKNYPEIGIAVPTSSSDEGIIEAKLREMLTAEAAKVIFSATDEEFEKNYQTLQENARKIGVEQLNEYMTAKVKQVKEDYGFE